jgi:aspartate/methionine/tyrosine aminotransferase
MPITVSRRSDVEPFHAMDVLAEANRLRAAGKDVISMAVGQPFGAVPGPVREAAELALNARPYWLHRRTGHGGAARGDRKTLSRPLCH